MLLPGCRVISLGINRCSECIIKLSIQHQTRSMTRQIVQDLLAGHNENPVTYTSNPASLEMPTEYSNARRKSS